ncbi:Uncharacterised protein [Mycobacteroides abscessus subsp. abscessus]|nr:Uncharacterised protein [Mycobacteroides abscessus subsp. abscessus]
MLSDIFIAVARLHEPQLSPSEFSTVRPDDV